MINSRSFIWAILLAIAIHAIAFSLALFQPPKVKTGAAGLGQHGVEVGLGLMGSLGDKTKPVAAPKPKPVTPPKPEPIEKPKPEKKAPPVKPKQKTKAVVKKQEKVKHVHKKKPPKHKVHHLVPVAVVPVVTHSTTTSTNSQNTSGSSSSTSGTVTTGTGHVSTLGGQSIAAKHSYESMLSALLVKAKRYPRVSQRRGEEGKVLATLTIAPSGEIISYRIKQSSGYRRLDNEVIRMIKSIHLPPFTDGMSKTPLTVTIPISFTMEDDG